MPVLTVDFPSTNQERTCVAIEPIAEDKIGKVAVAGAVQVRKNNLPVLADCSVLWSDDNWALVILGAGSVRLCKTTAAWPRNTEATLEVWESGEPPGEQPTVRDTNQVTLVAYNKSYNVAACVWVIVAKGKNGTWYLVEAAVPFDSESCDAPNISGHDLTTVSGYASNKKQALTHDENACLKWVDIESCE